MVEFLLVLWYALLVEQKYHAHELSSFTLGGGLRSITFASNPPRILTGPAESLQFWDLGLFKLATSHRFPGGVNSVRFQHTNRVVAVASSDYVQVWKEGASAKTVYRSHGGGVLALAITPDSEAVASADNRGFVRVWSTWKGKDLWTFNNNKVGTKCLAFLQGGEELVIADGEGAISVWSVQRREKICTIRAHEHSIQAMDLWRNILAVGCFDGSVSIWDVETLKCLKRLRAHSDVVFAVRFSPDGKLLVTGGADGHAFVWSTKSFDCVLKLLGHSAPIMAIDFSPDGRLIATADGGHFVREQSEVKLWWNVLSPDVVSDSGDGHRFSWEDLGSRDDVRKYRATMAVLRDRKKGIEFITKHLKPAVRIGNNELERLFTDLDAAEFKRRDTAMRRLLEIGEPAFPLLHDRLKDSISEEVRRRILFILNNKGVSGELANSLQAIRILEWVRCSTSRSVLRTLIYYGDPLSRLTREACGAFLRMQLAEKG